MARDIEEFLRKAAERRRQQAAAPAPPPQAPAPARPAPAAPPARKAARPRPAAPPAEVEVVRARGLGSGVAEHVRQHIDTSGISEHVRHLGEEIGQADERLQQRLHSRFDSALGGKLAVGRETVAELPVGGGGSTLAMEIVQLLRNPRALRQSILINELLRRPDF